MFNTGNLFELINYTFMDDSVNVYKPKSNYIFFFFLIFINIFKLFFNNILMLINNIKKNKI